MSEPNGTAFLLAGLGVLMVISVLLSRFADRVRVPVALLFIAVGAFAGADGPGGIQFDEYGLSFRLGTIALAVILFDGGLNTPLNSVGEGIRPAALLATIGVVLTATFVAVLARLLGLPWAQAALLGAIVSSTDAAAVFAVLRGSGLHLRRRVGVTLELESGLNDPMAVILTMAMTTALVSGELVWWRVLLDTVVQIAVGVGLGFAFGYLGRAVLRRTWLPAAGLYPVLTLAISFAAFGVPTLLYGSGFMAVYIAGILIGNASIRYRAGILRFHDGMAWFGQVAMFIMLGLLVTPSRLIEVAPIGIGLAVLIAIFARPVAVMLCLLPFDFRMKERAYLAWVGLRGAVPIILATFPILAGAPGGNEIFNIVFFVVVVGALLPGATVPWVTQRLGMGTDAPPPPTAMLEIVSRDLLSGEVAGFHISPSSAACGATLADLPLPPAATAAMIIRGSQLVAPRGQTQLLAGDHLYVFCQTEDLPLLELLFGQRESQ